MAAPANLGGTDGKYETDADNPLTFSLAGTVNGIDVSSITITNVVYYPSQPGDSDKSAQVQITLESANGATNSITKTIYFDVTRQVEILRALVAGEVFIDPTYLSGAVPAEVDFDETKIMLFRPGPDGVVGSNHGGTGSFAQGADDIQLLPLANFAVTYKNFNPDSTDLEVELKVTLPGEIEFKLITTTLHFAKSYNQGVLDALSPSVLSLVSGVAQQAAPAALRPEDFNKIPAPKPGDVGAMSSTEQAALTAVQGNSAANQIYNTLLAKEEALANARTAAVGLSGTALQTANANIATAQREYDQALNNAQNNALVKALLDVRGQADPILVGTIAGYTQPTDTNVKVVPGVTS